MPDRSHCQINFVGDSLLVSAHGYFEKWDGDFQIDRQDLANSTIRLTIDAASLNTRVERRDNHLRGPDFFDSAKYPQVTFVSTKIAKVGDSNYTLTGDSDLRGVTRSVDVPVPRRFRPRRRRPFPRRNEAQPEELRDDLQLEDEPVDDEVTVQFDLHLSDKEAMEKR